MSRFLRFMIALLLLPLVWAASHAVLLLLSQTALQTSLLSLPVLMLLGGFLAWLLLYLVLPPPAKTYIWGHELTHALWGLFFGARIHDIEVNRGGGYVMLSKTNLVITLAPYFFPFYTFLVLLVRLILHWCLPEYPLLPLWMFLIGLTWSFHCCMTVNSLLITQPDVMEHGRVFSWVIIYLLNLAVLAAGVILLMPAVSFAWFAEALFRLAGQVYLHTGAFFCSGAQKLWSLYQHYRTP